MMEVDSKTEKGYYFLKSDFLAAFAYWLVAQSPYDTPNLLPALNAFNQYLKPKFPDAVPVRFTYGELKNCINDKVFESIPEIEALNHPKIDTGVKYLAVSRCSRIDPDYDFIDLTALARNVLRMLISTFVVPPFIITMSSLGGSSSYYAKEMGTDDDNER